MKCNLIIANVILLSAIEKDVKGLIHPNMETDSISTHR